MHSEQVGSSWVVFEFGSCNTKDHIILGEETVSMLVGLLLAMGRGGAVQSD